MLFEASMFKGLVHRLSMRIQRAQSAESMDDFTERVRQAQTTGLEDAPEMKPRGTTKIEPRGDGWVVVYCFNSCADGHLVRDFLIDPETHEWVNGDDDEELPPTIFPTPEAAYGAWRRSQLLSNATNPNLTKAAIQFLAATVGAANYPTGARKAVGDFKYLPPVIPQEEVWRVTEAFVDHCVGSIDDLYRAIWGLGLQEYAIELGAREDT